VKRTGKKIVRKKKKIDQVEVTADKERTDAMKAAVKKEAEKVTKASSGKKAKVAAKKKAATKGAKKTKPASGEKKVGLLDHAYNILKGRKTGLTAQEIVDKAIEAGWSTNGKTPAATLSASLGREIRTAGKNSRFQKADRGIYTAN